jgi:hypothetical protein
MSFFDSEIVQTEIKHNSDILKTLNPEEPSIDGLQEWIEKTRVFYTRLSLSDDSEAIKTKNELNQLSNLMGFQNLTDCLDHYQETLQ